MSKKEMTLQISRHSDRIKAWFTKLEHYVMATKKLKEGNHNSEERNEVIKKAKLEKRRLSFEELDAAEPVQKKSFPKGLGCTCSS